MRLKSPGQKARQVLTVAQACRLLNRTRCQVYRYIETGILNPAGKLLGEWLLNQDAVERLKLNPLSVQPLPARLKPYFPEYRLSDLNAGRDKVLVISRVLEQGGRPALRWLTRRYPRQDILRFLEEDGARLLTRRALRLWSLVFEAHPRPIPAWRQADPWLKAQSGSAQRAALLEKLKESGPLEILGRGSRKDFMDLYHLSREIGLEAALKSASRKYRDHGDFTLQAARALVYFDDAEKEPMPRGLGSLSWAKIKSFFETEIPKLVKRQINKP